MKIELLFPYLLLVFLNLICGIKRNSIIIKYRNQRMDDRYYNRKTYKSHVLALLLVAFLVFIVGYNRNNPDYLAYKDIYDNEIQVEWGWMFFEKVAMGLGFQYDGFKTVIVAISFFLIFSGLIKMDVNENIVLAIYALYPFAMDAIQIRNLLATALLIYAYHFLNRNDKIGKVLFGGFILAASTIQSVFPIYLMLLIIDEKKSISGRNKLISVGIICSFFALFLMKVFPGLVKSIGLLLFSSRPDKINYYVQNNVGFGFLIFGLMHVLFTVSVYFCKKNNKELNDKEERLVNCIFWSDMLLLCALPLLTIHIEFYRIYRNLCLVNFTALPILMRKRTTINCINGRLCFIFAWIMYVIMDYFNYAGRFDYVFTPFFK